MPRGGQRDVDVLATADAAITQPGRAAHPKQCDEGRDVGGDLARRAMLGVEVEGEGPAVAMPVIQQDRRRRGSAQQQSGARSTRRGNLPASRPASGATRIRCRVAGAIRAA